MTALAPIPAPPFPEPPGEYQHRPDHGGDCAVCGRPLTEAAVARAWHVHLITDGTLAPAHWPDNDPEYFGQQGINDQGWFPVGSECARSIPLTHRPLRHPGRAPHDARPLRQGR